MASSELVTMLNPRTMSFSVRSGCAPTFTAEDVAHALSMISQQTKLGAALLCYIHAPDIAKLESVSAEQMLATLMQAERSRRMHEEHKTRIAYQIAKENSVAKNHVSSEEDRVLAKLRSMHAAAKSEMWPERGVNVEKIYIGIRRTILDDLKTRRVCKNCNGTKNVLNSDGLLVECDKCNGSGVTKSSMQRLAKKVGRHRNSINETWHDVYDFTHRAVTDALNQAEQKFREVTK